MVLRPKTGQIERRKSLTARINMKLGPAEPRWFSLCWRSLMANGLGNVTVKLFVGYRIPRTGAIVGLVLARLTQGLTPY